MENTANITADKNDKCKVTFIYKGGNGLQDAYRILAKILIERMECNNE